MIRLLMGMIVIIFLIIKFERHDESNILYKNKDLHVFAVLLDTISKVL